MVTAREVVQSAVSEAEQYRRVAASELEPCRIRGDFFADLSHLLAEFIENALVYSAVQPPVEVNGWRDLDENCLAAGWSSARRSAPASRRTRPACLPLSGHKTGATRFDFCVRSGGSRPCVPAC
ncbi:hypothetical protein [Streptomyces sp. NBC_01367]|uniref:hypothetical protein n=1 Tax=Streptomyces sp. NBC_01367 TaxID=2903841 RepID=UPI00324890C7